MGRADWSSVRTQAIKLYNKFGIVTDCSFQLPSTKDALQKRIPRPNFQAAVWKRACQSMFGLPSAEKHGWVIEKHMLSVDWIEHGIQQSVLFSSNYDFTFYFYFLIVTSINSF
jgi:hypothetical protein